MSNRTYIQDMNYLLEIIGIVTISICIIIGVTFLLKKFKVKTKTIIKLVLSVLCITILGINIALSYNLTKIGIILLIAILSIFIYLIIKLRNKKHIPIKIIIIILCIISTYFVPMKEISYTPRTITTIIGWYTKEEHIGRSGVYPDYYYRYLHYENIYGITLYTVE